MAALSITGLFAPLSRLLSRAGLRHLTGDKAGETGLDFLGDAVVNAGRIPASSLSAPSSTKTVLERTPRFAAKERRLGSAIASRCRLRCGLDMALPGCPCSLSILKETPFALEVSTIALPQVIERQTRSIASSLTPGELAEKLYPSRGSPMPADAVHSYVASQAVSVMARHLRAGGQEDFSVDQEMNLYLRRSRVAAPDMFLYRHRPISKTPGASSYITPRDSETHRHLKNHVGCPDPLALRIVRQVADVVSPHHVVLFGSRARGDWKPHSDIDLAIIGTNEGRDPQQANRARLTARKLASETYGKSIGVDVMYATPDALASFRGSLNNVLGHITREGVAMDGSPYDPNPAMPDSDADWLDIISRLGDAFRHARHLDMEVAEPFSLSRDKYLSHTAQQALEHCCKALLTALDATYPRTHELADLFDLVRAQDPTIPLPRQHLWLSEFAGDGFYASLETSIAELDELVADIHQACEMMISHILQLTGRDWNDLRGIYNSRPQSL